MPKISEERRTERREQILAGARRCFAEHGYEGATVARLEAEIGLSRGAIFNYFSSKEDLFVELAARGQRAHVGDLGRTRASRRSSREVVELDPAWLSRLPRAHPARAHGPGFRRRDRGAAGGGHARQPRAHRGGAARAASFATTSSQGDRRASSTSSLNGLAFLRARRRGAPEHRARARRCSATLSGASSARYASAYTRLTRSTSST